MTQFDLTSDQRQLFEHADRIGKEKLLPLAERMDNEELGRKIVAGFGALFISPLVFMFFWNWIMPAMFGLPVLSYLKAFGLLVMARLIFKHD